MDGLSKLVTHFVFLLTLCVTGAAHAHGPLYADGDLAPLGTPDGLINIAVGGLLPGSPDNSTVFPQRMLVDYIRVFQKQ